MAEIANVDQAASWDGPEGAHWSTNADRYDTCLREHLALLEATAGVGDDDRVLDIGCGNGTSTLNAARAAVRGHVVGIDLSTEMLARARDAASAAGLANVEFVAGDAQVYPFDPASFDVVISRFGVMFFADPVAAFTNVARALKPGGRIAWIVWRSLGENEFFSEVRAALAVGRDLPAPPSGVPSPFGLADRDYTERTLAEAGLASIELTPVNPRYFAESDADRAYEFVRGTGFTRFATQDLDEPDRERAFAALRQMLATHATSDGVVFDSACWLVTAVRPPA
jgi:SAM-dependent methyltransferase